MIGIYKITNLINNKSYIGQSIHIEQRWQEHLYKSSQSSLLKYALHKYGVDNFIFEVIEECEQSELNEREQYWIKYYNSFEDGYNLTMGGGGTVKYSVEAIYEDYQQTNSMKKTAKNFNCHENTVRAILREYGIDKSDLQQSKPVEQIDPQTLQVLKTYDSLQEAADAMNVVQAAIRHAADGTHDSSCGYYWRFVGDNTKVFPTKPAKAWKIPVLQIDLLTNEVLAEFASAADAATALGKDRKNGGSQISAVCSGRKKSAYGFKWQKK